ncbi:helix-turn-helix domain-containing protein [Salinisphaera sp. SPP-AMP-43]|uniref:GlxA family transcriptional regulator n=1 Tax=Salinisphaera sp. SPP-AMP-43 TaxID=3121288 RepID=UPI003C6E6D67
MPADLELSPMRVGIVVVPEAIASTLGGLYDVLDAPRLGAIAAINDGGDIPFHVNLVGERAERLQLADGLPWTVQHGIDDIAPCELIIVPSLLLPPHGWQRGRYPRLVAWLGQSHARGAVLASACSGLFLLAETGIFDGHHATVHRDHAPLFSKSFPAVALHPKRALVVSGVREELISSGASIAWHDLALYLIVRFVSVSAARSVARFFDLQWRSDDLAPGLGFDDHRGHSDVEILAAQDWLAEHFTIACPVAAMCDRSGLGERTFKRHFITATGLSPIAYVQRLRIEAAKRRLENSALSVDDISWHVGYEDPTFFRRLFKRTTGLTPGAYRRRFGGPRAARQPTPPDPVP